MAIAHDRPGAVYRSAMETQIGARWRDLWKALPAVTTNDDPEAVHDVRVASRRFRAAMDAAVSLFPPKWFHPLHQLSREITRALGEVRDRDVVLESLRAERERADPAEWLAIDHLIARFTREREDARASMRTFLDGLDTRKLKNVTRRRFPSVPPECATATTSTAAKKGDRTRKVKSA
jgi:CHAD domain-containing protein